MTGAAGGQAALLVAAGGQRFAVAADRIREVARVPRLTAVPQAPSRLLGLGNVRGEVLAVLALADPAPAGLPGRSGPGPHVRRSHLLLVLTGEARVALAIDRVDALVRDEATAEANAEPLAIDALIEASVPPRPAARRNAGHDAGGARRPPEEQIALLRLAVAGQSFALPLDEVEAVLALPDDIAPLAGGNRAAIGTCVYRDASLGLASLAVLLGLATHPPVAMSGKIVVAIIGAHRVGLLVDRLDGLLRLGASRIDPVPAALARSDGDARIRAIARPANGRLVSVLATETLFDEAMTRQLHLSGRRSVPAPMQGAVRHATHLRFRIGAHALAFPLAAVVTVALLPAKLTRIPGAPPAVLGIAAIGDALLPVIDQVLRLTGRTSDASRRRVIVVGIGSDRAGFLVDEVDGLIAAAATVPAPLPATIADGIIGEVLTNTGSSMEDGTGPSAAELLILSPEAMLGTAERDILTRASKGSASEIHP